MCYSAPSKHRNWTVKRRHKMLSASIFILWEWWVRFKEHLHTSAVLHLKETLNNWRLRAEMASWSACIKLWGLDPGLKNTYTNLYFSDFKEDYILCAFKVNCQGYYSVLYDSCQTRTRDCPSELTSIGFSLITRCYVGHWLQDDRDEMSHVLKLCLWQIQDLIGRIKIKVPGAVWQ